VTAILARLLAREHLARLQAIGVAVAVVAIVFIST
jgi:drug/metabolite transporter (DMT)-like permease